MCVQCVGPVALSTSCKLISPGVVINGTLSVTKTELYFEMDEEDPKNKEFDQKVCFVWFQFVFCRSIMMDCKNCQKCKLRQFNIKLIDVAIAWYLYSCCFNGLFLTSKCRYCSMLTIFMVNGISMRYVQYSAVDICFRTLPLKYSWQIAVSFPDKFLYTFGDEYLPGTVRWLHLFALINGCNCYSD